MYKFDKKTSQVWNYNNNIEFVSVSYKHILQEYVTQWYYIYYNRIKVVFLIKYDK